MTTSLPRSSDVDPASQRPAFRDRRLFPAADLIHSGTIKLLAIDVFDTLLGRRVPSPRDVFLRLGARLQMRHLLATTQTADSFAAIRYQTEHASRHAQQKRRHHREVTLAEIYESFPPHILRGRVDELVAAEIEVERELCFANSDIIKIAVLAKQTGLKLALVSNSYFDETTLRALVRGKAPDFPEIDAFYVSSDHRRGKRDGLLRKMLEHFSVSAEQCLLLGDDPISDRTAASELGMACVFLGHTETVFAERLREEHPIQWHERLGHYGQNPNGDYGVSWLRRQAEHWTPAGVTDDERGLYVYGAQMLGPLLAAFAAWAGARAKAENARTLFGIAREGHLLSDLVSTLDPSVSCRILAASRLAVALASFSKERPDYLEDFLDRRGHWTLATLLLQLGFDEQQVRFLGDPTTTLEMVSASQLTEMLMVSPLAEDLFRRSAERRRNLLRYMKQIGALEGETLFLLDLGYAGTIQRSLQRIFTIEKVPIRTHGLYMVSAHVSLATQSAGGIVEGFLAQNGNPNDFARAFCRSPEIVELSCMPPYGTVSDYQSDGTPIRDRDSTPARQLREVAVVQEGIKEFAGQFKTLVGSLPAEPNYNDTGWRSQIRGIATRLVVYPSAAEAAQVAHWLADSDLGLASPRAIVSIRTNSDKVVPLGAVELVALPRRDVPWLYGVAAALGEDKRRQVAALMLRREPASAYASGRNLEPSLPSTGPTARPIVWESPQNPSPAPANPLQLKNLVDTAFDQYALTQSFDRVTWLHLLTQPSLEDRHAVFSQLTQRFAARGESKLAHGLRIKLWRLGLRNYENFKALWPSVEKRVPDVATWQFLKEALVAAMSADDKDYVLDIAGWSHAMSYNGYYSRGPYTPFQDSLLIGAVTQALSSLKPVLARPEPAATRTLRLCYAISSELGEDYSPIMDLAFALPETHDPAKVDVSLVFVHSEAEVLASTRARGRLELLKAKGYKSFFWPPSMNTGPAAQLKRLADDLAAQRFDAILFPTLTNRLFTLAAMRPAHLMVGLGFGDIDIYSSPLLDFTAHMCDFPRTESLCPGYRLPDFMPPGRFRTPAAPLTKKGLGIPEEAILIMSSGRPIKFYSEAYWRSVTAILTQRPGVHLAVIGPTYTEIKDWLLPHLAGALLPRVHFLGWRRDHAEVLSAGDIGLDTFPMCGGFNLTEIMHLGVPTVLCHNVTEEFLGPYSNEIFMPIGELVDIEELNLPWKATEAIIATVLRLVDDPELRRTLGQASKVAALRRGDAKPATLMLEDMVRHHLSNAHPTVL
ncbi:MAG: hypothetical protein M3N08_04735 [Pseudomonadota bacterium]|nr:hypothetical protein [Pseudomonadota bacterium]